ncbi:MAG: hypothetical protein LUO93_05540 [Methanomicrobiales archaeon]|nr:hypothetical protein [Methanomicrobiales archaeon]
MAMVPVVPGRLIGRIPHSEHFPHLSVALVGVAITWFVIAIIGPFPLY